MRTRDGINLFFSYKNIYQRIYRDYMPVVLGDNSISVGGKVIETVKFSGQVGDPLGTGEPTVTVGGPVTPVIINNDFKYMAFLNNGENQTSYTVNFPEAKTCDILVVAGGGGGGNSIGAGGGAGGLVYITGYVLNAGTYTILVGKGGIGQVGQNTHSTEDGKNSTINLGGTNIITALGGGNGQGQSPAYNGNENRPGGSGSGGTRNKPTGASATQKTGTTGISSTYGRGNSGGNYNDSPAFSSAGGGGAGNVGGNGTTSKGGDGGVGFPVDITGTNIYYAGGGGGVSDDDNTNTTNGIGGLGGGGTGVTSGNGVPGTNGLGGGGGGGSTGFSGGNGGSGIVIIRYPRNKVTFDAQWTYNASNANVYHLGNVGIGITNPTNALHVTGNTFSTTYSANSKTFKIEHPLKINKWLYHGCIEGPRFDNIYRGKKLIIAGKAEVDIDKECNTTGGMTPGTFPILNTNTQLFLRNNKTYDRVKGKINGSTINIECENTTDEIEVDWMVVGERHDEHVISTPLTDSDGNLICEHEMA